MDRDPFSDDLYHLLGVGPGASHREIEAACRKTEKIYARDAIATASLLTVSHREAILEKIARAESVLLDEEKRERYDGVVGAALFPEEGGSAPRGGPETTGGDVQPERIRIRGKVSDQLHYSGSVLRRMRELRGIGMDEMADRTKIAKNYLKAIEENRFDLLPPVVYLRGYLKSYLKEVGREQPEIVDSYLSLIQLFEKLGKEKKRWYASDR